MKHLSYLLATLLPYVTFSLGADCTTNGNPCNWHGESPGCGEDGRNWGYTGDDGWTLVVTSAKYDHAELEAHGYVNEECGKAYGAGCWSGYKRLWCHTGLPPSNGYPTP